jgi:hypothetical protein
MRVEFCVLTDSDGRSVGVNPIRVRCVRALPRDYTSIEFDKDHKVIVRESVDDILRTLTTIESD